MRSKLIAAVLSGVVCSLLGIISIGRAADAPKAKVTYQDQVSPIFRSRCGSCHNADKQKGGLNLDSYGAMMQGGGSGKVVEAGDADNSKLLLVVTHEEEPKMPPASAKIPDGEIDVIRKWIEGGALENSGSVASVKAKPKFEFKLDPKSLGKPSGPPAMPEGVTTEPFVPQAKPGAVVAMAASPWAPLVAIAGHKQVLLYRTTDNHLVGVLPFPEGLIYVLKFSRNGDLLLAGGGRGGQSGLAVAWDVKKGTRVFEVGKEYDIVLAADISPDHGQVALGGPSKVVRVYNTADGSLAFEMRKHTEWITAAEFSPDGVLLATGDRNNGLIVWESATGREFYDLRGHASFITDVSWRLDSNVLASSSEDGTIKLWEMENGGNIKNIGAHGGGALSVRFAKDGRLVTTGRDRVVRLWDANGNKQRDFEGFGDLALEAVFTHDDAKVVAGDWSGEIRVWDVKDGRRLANLVVNPAPLALRLQHATQALAAAQSEADSIARQLAPFQNAIGATQAALAQVQAKVSAAEQAAGKQNAAVQQLDQALKAKVTAAQEAGTTLLAAHQLGKQTADAVTAADAAVGQTAQAEKVASDALNAAKAAAEKAMADKSAHDPALAAAFDGPQGRDDARGGRQSGRGVEDAGEEGGRAGPGDRGLGKPAFGRAAGTRPGHRRPIGGTPGRGPDSNTCPSGDARGALGRRSRHAGQPGEGRGREVPRRRPHGASGRDESARRRQERAGTGDCCPNGSREGPGREAGAARRSGRQGAGAQVRGGCARRREEAVRRHQGRTGLGRTPGIVRMGRAGSPDPATISQDIDEIGCHPDVELSEPGFQLLLELEEELTMLGFIRDIDEDPE